MLCKKCGKPALEFSTLCRACLEDHCAEIKRKAWAAENLEKFKRRQAKRGKRLPALHGVARGEVIS